MSLGWESPQRSNCLFVSYPEEVVLEQIARPTENPKLYISLEQMQTLKRENNTTLAGGVPSPGNVSGSGIGPFIANCFLSYLARIHCSIALQQMRVNEASWQRKESDTLQEAPCLVEAHAPNIDLPWHFPIAAYSNKFQFLYIAAWAIREEAYLNLLRSPSIQVSGLDLCDMYANGAMDSRAANTHEEPEVP